MRKRKSSPLVQDVKRKNDRVLSDKRNDIDQQLDGLIDLLSEEVTLHHRERPDRGQVIEIRSSRQMSPETAQVIELSSSVCQRRSIQSYLLEPGIIFFVFGATGLMASAFPSRFLIIKQAESFAILSALITLGSSFSICLSRIGMRMVQARKRESVARYNLVSIAAAILGTAIIAWCLNHSKFSVSNPWPTSIMFPRVTLGLVAIAVAVQFWGTATLARILQQVSAKQK